MLKPSGTGQVHMAGAFTSSQCEPVGVLHVTRWPTSRLVTALPTSRMVPEHW